MKCRPKTADDLECIYYDGNNTGELEAFLGYRFEAWTVTGFACLRGGKYISPGTWCVDSVPRIEIYSDEAFRECYDLIPVHPSTTTPEP